MTNLINKLLVFFNLKRISTKPTNKILLCNDCKHHLPSNVYDGFDLCTSPRIDIKINPVTGGVEKSFCKLQRMFSSSKCGPEGNLWEPQQEDNND